MKKENKERKSRNNKQLNHLMKMKSKMMILLANRLTPIKKNKCLNLIRRLNTYKRLWNISNMSKIEKKLNYQKHKKIKMMRMKMKMKLMMIKH